MVVNDSSSTWKRRGGDASTYFSPLLTVCFQEKQSASVLLRGERRGQAEVRVALGRYQSYTSDGLRNRGS